MLHDQKALIGPGRFQWNFGGMAGSSLGGTAWMLLTAGFLATDGQIALATLVITCFLVTNAVAVVLWLRRDTIFPFAGIMILLGVLSVTIPVTWIAVTLFASAEVLSRMNWPNSWTMAVVMCLLAPMLMVYFTILERSHHSHSTAKSLHARD